MSHYQNFEPPFEIPDSWEWVRLDELFHFIRNGKAIQQSKGAKGLPITRIETISKGTLDRSKMGYANIEETSHYQEYLLENGDILMSHMNSPCHIGKSAVCEDIQENEAIIHGMNLLCLRPYSMIAPQYIGLYFQSSIFYFFIRPFIKNAVNQASINTANLGGVYIPLPGYNEQRRIVKTFFEIAKVIKVIALNLEDLSAEISLTKSKSMFTFKLN